MEEKDAKKCVHILISGLVQGVYFRAHTRDLARSLGITGFVRNLPDGRVEVMAQGNEETLKKLIAWCHRGPPGAEVTAVSVTWELPNGEFADFAIRY